LVDVSWSYSQSNFGDFEIQCTSTWLWWLR